MACYGDVELPEGRSRPHFCNKNWHLLFRVGQLTVVKDLVPRTVVVHDGLATDGTRLDHMGYLLLGAWIIPRIVSRFYPQSFHVESVKLIH